MGPVNQSKGTDSHFSSADVNSGGVIWCFVPTGERNIGSCSIGFRDYFELHPELPAVIGFSNPELVRAFEAKGLSVDCLFEDCKSTDSPLASGSILALEITAQTVLDSAGLPVGRLLIFERTTSASLPEKTIQRLQESQQKLRLLSAREAEILDFVYNGMTNKAIGIQSKISEKTVEKHRSNIMSKLGIRNSSHLIRCVNDARLANELEVNDCLEPALPKA